MVLTDPVSPAGTPSSTPPKMRDSFEKPRTDSESPTSVFANLGAIDSPSLTPTDISDATPISLPASLADEPTDSYERAVRRNAAILHRAGVQTLPVFSSVVSTSRDYAPPPANRRMSLTPNVLSMFRPDRSTIEGNAKPVRVTICSQREIGPPPPPIPDRKLIANQFRAAHYEQKRMWR